MCFLMCFVMCFVMCFLLCFVMCFVMCFLLCFVMCFLLVIGYCVCYCALIGTHLYTFMSEKCFTKRKNPNTCASSFICQTHVYETICTHLNQKNICLKEKTRTPVLLRLHVSVTFCTLISQKIVSYVKSVIFIYYCSKY